MTRSVLSKMFSPLLSALFISCFMPGFISAADFTTGWLSGWANRIPITIDQTKIDSTLSDFPVMVHLSQSSGMDSADVSSVFDVLSSNDDRKKIAITTSNGINQCYVEIEQWDSTDANAVLWIKVPLISSTSNTVIYW